MLTQLSIKNFGLIEAVSLEFNKSLNILTGETGAGKSILIEALRIVLGDRITSSELRDTSSPCIIEAVFDIFDKELKKKPVFEDFLSNEDSQLIIQRTYFSDGKNKIKINGLNVTVGQLREIGDNLVDFHGPHDHQMLLSCESHMGMLDRLINFEGLFNKYHDIFNKYIFLQKQLEELEKMSDSRDRELDMLVHQIKEMEQVKLDDTVHDEILQLQTKINNAQRLNTCVAEILNLLEGNENNACDNIMKAFSFMRSLNNVDEKTGPLMEYLNQIQAVNDQLITELHNYVEKLSFQPHQAQEINSKCDIYDDIKRKYGPSLKDARDFYEHAKEKYNLLINLEHNDCELRKQIDHIKKELKNIAQDITNKRKKASLSLKKTIEKELTELGISNVLFESRIEKAEFGENGADKVTFYISPNAGEDLKPLAEIVSSGEAARVMLALKKALIKVDPIPVLIFDEIDAQIGGRLGTITGQKLREISKIRQVILITHLPQIASFADSHFKVKKFVKNNRAVTSVEKLDKKSRVDELAKMMSGEKESKIAIKHANDMLSNAKNL